MSSKRVNLVVCDSEMTAMTFIGVAYGRPKKEADYARLFIANNEHHMSYVAYDLNDAGEVRRVNDELRGTIVGRIVLCNPVITSLAHWMAFEKEVLHNFNLEDRVPVLRIHSGLFRITNEILYDNITSTERNELSNKLTFPW